MRWIVSLALLTLAGCAPDVAGPALKPDLPALPATATENCTRPAVKVGDDLGVAALKWKASAICEKGKRGALISYYDDLKTGLAGKE